MIKLQRFIFNPFHENTYIVWDEDSSEAAVIDPGCYNKFEENELGKFIENRGLFVKYLINTHCHIDHIFGNDFVIGKFNAPLYAPEKDAFLLESAVEHAKFFEVRFNPSPKPDKFITEDLKLFLGKSPMKFIFTPGHTPGEFCILFEEKKICITGDVLFRESIGRTDLPGGNHQTLIDSIKNKLMTLPDDIQIFPGHGESSNIGYERNNNPFL